ncbi:MAG: hypothetical protein IJ278_04095 [Clostridia bacterium]|nr:hypothetical protein [Clostridia bacterium]
MEYINSISIGNYKGIRRLNIDSFSSINIITGPNGSGKTALLNGLEILTNPSDFFHYIKASGKTFESFKNSFHKREPRPCSNIAGLVLQNFYGIEITSYFPIDNESFIGYHHFTYQAEKEKKVKTTQISYSFSDKKDSSVRALLPFRTVSPNDTSVCLKRIWEDDRIKEKVLSLLALFDEEICDFHTEDFKEYFLYHNTYGNLSPSFFSDGIQFLLKIAEALSGYSNGILAVDGFECLLAKNTVREAVNFIYQLSKERQIQLFLVTQSAEIIDEWLDLLHFYNELNLLTILRLRSDKETTSCQITDGERAYQIRLEKELDFRDEKQKENDR